MNKHAQLSALAFMLAVTVIILALAWVFPVNQVATSAMNETAGDIYGDNAEVGSGMNCTGTIDDFTKAGCWVLDMTQFYFIGGILAIAGLIIGAKIIMGATS